MSRLIPLVLAVVAIAAFTIVEGSISQRWTDGRHPAYCASLLDQTPNEFAGWVGSDVEVDDVTQQGAGAMNYVNRTYRRTSNGDEVSVWLILGHARDTARHTPDICYYASDFKSDDDKSKYTLQVSDNEEASFFTNVFFKELPTGRAKTRVFWTWFKPVRDSGGPVRWSAPDNVRYEIGAAPALYKMYFSCVGPAAEGKASESICNEFARDFIPLIAPILEKSNGSVPADFDASTVKEV